MPPTDSGGPVPQGLILCLPEVSESPSPGQTTSFSSAKVCASEMLCCCFKTPLFFFNKGKRNSQMLLGHQVVLQSHDPDEFGVIEPKPFGVVFSGMPRDQRTRVCKGLGGVFRDLSPSRPLTRRGLSQRQMRAVLPYSCTSQPQDHRRGPRNSSVPCTTCLEGQGHLGGVTVPQSYLNSLGSYWQGGG